MSTSTNNLYDSVYAAIALCSPRLADRFRRNFDVLYVGDRHLHGDQISLNHFWRLELGLLECNTIAERECLDDNCPPDIWMHNFIQYVLPTIVREKLPRAT